MAFNFYGRGVPVRVLCLEAGADTWSDVLAILLAHLQHAFAGRKPFARAPLADGRWHVFDFALMLRHDEAEPGAHTAASLAWYDEVGAAFLPPGKAHLPVDAASDGFVIDEDEAVSIVGTWTLDTAVITRAERFVPDDSGIRLFRAMEQKLGNVKLGWYGASPADVKMAGKTSFQRPNWNLLGESRAHGQGLHLSPLRFPHLSMNIAEADHSGEACVLLCRVVQGLPVAIYAGSRQSCNARHKINSSGGVDYLPNPSWYVVWAEHMSTCIIPLCMVKFIKRPALQVLGPIASCVPMFVNMQRLRREIKRFLPSSQLQDLDSYFDTDTNRGNSQKDRNMACNHLPRVGVSVWFAALDNRQIQDNTPFIKLEETLLEIFFFFWTMH